MLALVLWGLSARFLGPGGFPQDGCLIWQDAHWKCLRDAPSDKTGESAIVRAERSSNGSCRSVRALLRAPKEARAKIRAELEAGFHTCRFGNKKVRTLHQLGRCYLLPGVDYLDYSFAGEEAQDTMVSVVSALAIVWSLPNPSGDAYGEVNTRVISIMAYSCCMMRPFHLTGTGQSPGTMTLTASQ